MLLQARACAPTDGMESIAHSRAARRTATVRKDEVDRDREDQYQEEDKENMAVKMLSCDHCTLEGCPENCNGKKRR